jgi:predicted nucleotidyltransferase
LDLALELGAPYVHSEHASHQPFGTWMTRRQVSRLPLARSEPPQPQYSQSPIFPTSDGQVFLGSFARETQTDSSDVDVLVFRDPPAKRISHSLNPLFLEEELPKVWRRDVDVVYTTGEEFRGYILVEALLCSRTLFGSDEDDEVIRLRNQAKDILETGYAKFSTILDAIRKAQKEGNRSHSRGIYTNLYI